MLRLRRLNRAPLTINLQAIACIEQTPDTLIVLMNGDRIHVAESVDEVVAQAKDFLTRVQAGAIALASRESSRQEEQADDLARVAREDE